MTALTFCHKWQRAKYGESYKTFFDLYNEAMHVRKHCRPDQPNMSKMAWLRLMLRMWNNRLESQTSPNHANG